jgi:type II secretory pathway component PulF
MPTFEWEGRSQQGELRKGVLAAESIEQLRSLVRKDGVFLTKADEKAEARQSAKASARKKVKQAQVGILTRQLATMIDSGLPLVQSLEALSTQLENATLRAITGR